MTRDEQIKIVEKATRNVREKIVRQIRSGKLPEDWDGFELLQHIADTHNECTHDMTPARKRAYQKARYQRSLWWM